MTGEGRYVHIKSRFWMDEKVRGWSDDAKLLALYLLTSPHNNVLGCYVLPELYACADLGWERKRFAKAFARLVEDDFVKVDPKTDLVLIVNYLRHNPIDNGNRAEGAIKVLAELPRSGLFKVLAEMVRELGKPYLEQLAQALESWALGSSGEGDPEGFGVASLPKRD